ncbi:MAG: transcription elongation factor GreA [Solirubrobacterales bacterium]
MSAAKPLTESISEQGMADLRAEIEELAGPGRRAMAERIKAARELGDLKENADYHIAKEDQAHLETKIKRLRRRLQLADVVEVDAKSDLFAFGRTAEVRDEEDDKVHTWTLVGATEGNLTEGRISVESPVGGALRDARIGAAVRVNTPRGEKSYRVEKLVG